MPLEVFSKLNDSMILIWNCTCPFPGNWIQNLCFSSPCVPVSLLPLFPAEVAFPGGAVKDKLVPSAAALWMAPVLSPQSKGSPVSPTFWGKAGRWQRKCHWGQVRAGVKNCNGKSSASGEGQELEGVEEHRSVILFWKASYCTEGAVSITTLGCALVHLLISKVGKNQTDPCSVLAVWKCLQQPVTRTEHGNSKNP